MPFSCTADMREITGDAENGSKAAPMPDIGSPASDGIFYDRSTIPMENYHRCPHCGSKIGMHQVHTTSMCEAAQKAAGTPPPWPLKEWPKEKGGRG